MIYSLDTETQGIDFHHGTRPYLVTFCNERSENIWWEWQVNPKTRMPIIPPGDLSEIQDLIDEAELLILHNTKFDYQALQTVFRGKLRWDWTKVRDTLLAGHLLASNLPHDLTSMAIQYLQVNIEPYEKRLEKVVKECRKYAKREYPEWQLAKVGLPSMPSVKAKDERKRYRGDDKDTLWKADGWLPAAIAKAENLPKGECEVVNKRREPFDVYIGRGSKWGNPFVIGRDGTREEVIEKYRRWIIQQPWLQESLPGLDGKRLGCFCKPLPCHGDVLQELLKSIRHENWDVLADYANADSGITLPLYRVLERELKRRKLWRIYEERLKLLPIVADMENRGVTLSAKRMKQLEEEYTRESDEAERVCVRMAGVRKCPDCEKFTKICKRCGGKGLRRSLNGLPKGGGLTNDLRWVLFNKFKLPVHFYTDTGQPSGGSEAIDAWLSQFAEDTPEHQFVKAMKDCRKRRTALAYMNKYRWFWIPLNDGDSESFVIHPSLNPTGTNTLRWASSNPNSQQICKQEGFNTRYIFGPAPGREWWSMDYENIELRIPAYESGEQAMIDLFEKPNDPPFFGSYHLLNASIVYPDLFWPLADQKGAFKKKYASTWYQWIKNAGFALIYGCMEDMFDLTAKKPGAYSLLKRKMPKLFKLNDHYIKMANKYGFVETLPDKTVDPARGYPIMCSRTQYGKIKPTVPLNYHVQGTAMWCTMKAMIRCYEKLQSLPGYFITLQVHDELVFDFPAKGKENLPIVQEMKRLMEMSGEDIGVPLRVSPSYHPSNWSQEEELK